MTLFRRTPNIRRTKPDRRYYERRREVEERRKIKKEVEVSSQEGSAIEHKTYSNRPTLQLPLQEEASNSSIISPATIMKVITFALLLVLIVVYAAIYIVLFGAIFF